MTASSPKQPADLDYVRIPLKMMQTGNFKAEACLVYSYMLNRYRYFTELAKSRHKHVEYYESIPAMSNQISVSESTIKRSLKVLKQYGYIEYQLTRRGNSFNNSYTVYDKHNIYQNKQTTVLGSPKQSQTEDTRPLWMRDDFDETDLPF